jgi:hypothetical protein
VENGSLQINGQIDLPINRAVNNLGEGWESFVTVTGKQGESVGDEREEKMHEKQLVIAFQKLQSNLTFGLGPTPIKNMVGVNQTLCCRFYFQPRPQ